MKRIQNEEPQIKKPRNTHIYFGCSSNVATLEQIVAKFAAKNEFLINAITKSEFIRDSIRTKGFRLPKSHKAVMRLVKSYKKKIKSEFKNKISKMKLEHKKFSLSFDKWTSQCWFGACSRILPCWKSVWAGGCQTVGIRFEFPIRYCRNYQRWLNSEDSYQHTNSCATITEFTWQSWMWCSRSGLKWTEDNCSDDEDGEEESSDDIVMMRLNLYERFGQLYWSLKILPFAILFCKTMLRTLRIRCCSCYWIVRPDGTAWNQC